MKIRKLSTLTVLGLIFFSIQTGKGYAQLETKKIGYSDEYNIPKYVIEYPNTKLTQNYQKLNKNYILEFLETNKDLFKLTGKIESQFDILSKEYSHGAYHFNIIQKFNNIPVYASTSKLSFNNKGELRSYFGNIIPTSSLKNVSTTPNISKEKAIDTVMETLPEYPNIKKNNITIGLNIYDFDSQLYLAYMVEVVSNNPYVGKETYFIDAHKGFIINSSKTSSNIVGRGEDVGGYERTFQTSFLDNDYYLKDQTRGNGITTLSANNLDRLTYQLISQLYGYRGKDIISSTQYFNDPVAVSAHVNTTEVFDYFKKKFQRNSLDNKGGEIFSTIHVGDNWNNATWNGVQFVYGDGDGEKFSSMTGGLDVVAHEFTHAVIQNEGGLVYEGETGALNESLADIMAVMVDRDNWVIGEDIYTPNIPNDSLRSIKEPNVSGFPDHYSQKEEVNDDFHYNSTINSKAAYLISEGGSHYNIDVKGIGRDATEQIYYRALTQYLTPKADFHMMRQAAILSSIDLYGENSKQEKAVKQAYKAVGIE